jgi:hypothetical protein
MAAKTRSTKENKLADRSLRRVDLAGEFHRVEELQSVFHAACRRLFSLMKLHLGSLPQTRKMKRSRRYKRDKRHKEDIAWIHFCVPRSTKRNRV